MVMSLTLSWQRPQSYRNQSFDWVLYDNGLRHERVKEALSPQRSSSGRNIFYVRSEEEVMFRGSWGYLLFLYLSLFKFESLVR